MSEYSVDNSFCGKKTPEEILKKEKAVYKLSPDILRINRKKQRIIENKQFFVPTFKGKQIKRKKKEAVSISKKIFWMDSKFFVE